MLSSFAGQASSYTEETISNVLGAIGVEVRQTTGNDFVALCPIHGNTDDPALTVSRDKGIWVCHNPACAESGRLEELVIKSGTAGNLMEALRFIMKNEVSDNEAFARKIKKRLAPKEVVTFDQAVIDKMHHDLWATPAAIEYLHGRKFTDETINHFKLGYSVKKNLIATPMHDIDGRPVGVVGRTIVDKRFRNSNGLPTRDTLFNIHRARYAGTQVVVTESNFDALRVHQAGFPCVVASLGGHMGEEKIKQIDRYFDSIIIMTDDDPKQVKENCRKCKNEGKFVCSGHYPGRELGQHIAHELKHKRIYWAHTGTDKRFPPGCKDAGDMTDDQIRAVVKNKISSLKARSYTL